MTGGRGGRTGPGRPGASRPEEGRARESLLRRALRALTAGGGWLGLASAGLFLAAYNLQLFPVHLVVLVPALVWMERAASFRQAARRAAVSAALMQLGGGLWFLSLLRYSVLAPIICFIGPAYYVLWTAAVLISSDWLRRRLRWPLWATLPLVWVLHDCLMGFGDLRLQFVRWCHMLTFFPSTLQFTEWTGPDGASLWVVGVNALLFESWRAWRSGRRKVSLASLVVAVGLAVAVPVYGVARMRQVGREMAAAERWCDSVALQPNIDVPRKQDRSLIEENTESILALARQSTQGAALVVMPESSLPGGIRHFLALSDRPSLGPFAALAREGSFHLLVGTEYVRIRTRDDLDIFNAAFLLGPDGEIVDWNAKAWVLPIVEGLPYLPRLGINRIPIGGSTLLGQLGGMALGEMGRPLVVREAMPVGKIGVVICSEEFYGAITRKLARNGAELIANMSEDTWYAGSPILMKFLSRMIVARVIETRRSCVRAANTGISGFVTPDGVFHDATAQWTRTAVRRSLPVLTRQTFYVRHGAWLALVSAIWLTLAAAGALFRKPPA